MSDGAELSRGDGDEWNSGRVATARSWATLTPAIASHMSKLLSVSISAQPGKSRVFTWQSATSVEPAPMTSNTPSDAAALVQR